jgi:GGDEF domain-containing protein
MIHHFVCAYIGPEGDFKKQQNLVCPKCLKPLKHIGVDFDRPSTVYQCRHCQKNSQETDVDAICIHCGKRSLPENLIKKTLKEYQLTSFGEHSAKFGIVISLKEALKVDLEIVELNVFKMFLQLECERIKRYKISRSTVGVFIINNFIDLFAEFGKRSREISGEMSRVISQTLRTTDIISHLSDSTLIFLLTETSLENARQAMNRLKNRIVELIKVNFKKDVQIKTECIPVQKNSSSDELMKKAEKYV